MDGNTFTNTLLGGTFGLLAYVAVIVYQIDAKLDVLTEAQNATSQVTP